MFRAAPRAACLNRRYFETDGKILAGHNLASGEMSQRVALREQNVPAAGTQALSARSTAVPGELTGPGH